jgi:hypothetical protein
MEWIAALEPLEALSFGIGGWSHRPVLTTTHVKGKDTYNPDVTAHLRIGFADHMDCSSILEH